MATCLGWDTWLGLTCHYFVPPCFVNPPPLQATGAQQRELSARDSALAALQAEAAASQAGLQRELEEARQQLQGEVGNLTRACLLSGLRLFLPELPLIVVAKVVVYSIAA